jgi:hypothetical protein
MIGKALQGSPYLFFGLMRFALIKQHPTVHPVSLRKNGIQIAAAAKGGFSQICQPRIVIKRNPNASTPKTS